MVRDEEDPGTAVWVVVTKGSLNMAKVLEERFFLLEWEAWERWRQLDVRVRDGFEVRPAVMYFSVKEGQDDVHCGGGVGAAQDAAAEASGEDAVDRGTD